MDTLSDLVLHHNYTSREGGERLRHAAREAAENKLPGEGWCLFDIRHDFADAWELFVHDRRRADRQEDDCGRRHEDDWRLRGEGERGHRDEDDYGHRCEDARRLSLRFTRNMFPFIPRDGELRIEEMELLFNRCEHCDCQCPGECPCCVDPTRASYEVKLEREHEEEEQYLKCVLSDQWPGLYHGVVETRVGPLHSKCEHTEVRFCFCEAMCCLDRAYLLCRYNIKDRCPRRKEYPPLKCNPCDSCD
jgi:hypothetical protein